MCFFWMRRRQEYNDLMIVIRKDEVINFEVSLSLRFKLMSRKYKFLYFFRMCSYYCRIKDKTLLEKLSAKFFFVVYTWLEASYNTEISPLMEIGGGLCLPHPTGIILNNRVVIGENCTILQHVTIGNTIKNKGDLPILGDNIFIGAGAKIIGACSIGNGAIIGANAVVVKNISSGVTVVGVPAKALKLIGKQ